jgi:hypothetical protein
MSESSFLRELVVMAKEYIDERRGKANQEAAAGSSKQPGTVGVDGTPSSAKANFATDRTVTTIEQAMSSLEDESESKVPPLEKFKYSNRLWYMWCGRFYQMDDFIRSDWDQTELLSHTFKHEDGTRVTLIPVIHLAHPQFYGDVDALCSMHQSVLMEGRYGNLEADATTLPAREPLGIVRPKEEMDSEGWEPINMDEFFQPFSWGVKGSKANTVVHAGDKYDYENLPWFASIRFNVPMVGSLAREKHCLNQIPILRKNGYKSFAVPWGAAHMPAFATMLEQNGFQPVAEQRLVGFNAIDGPISAAWTKQLRVQLRLAGWARLAWRSIPGVAPVYFAWCLFDNELPFHYVPSPKPMMPWYWVS